MGNFYTDTIQYDKRFNSTERISDILLLEPVTRKIVQSIIEQAKLNGLELMVFETYRSQDRQALLYERGATKLQKVGVHHYGLACDIVRSINGEPSWKGDFSLLGQLAWHNKVTGEPQLSNTLLSMMTIYSAAQLAVRRRYFQANGILMKNMILIRTLKISYRGAGITAESPCFIRIIPHLRRLLWHKLMGITITPETQRSSRLSSANA